tara:strand:+ start:15717 stop:16499 length:783 start_codon:yes stop_codon:yes gene_type:complete
MRILIIAPTNFQSFANSVLVKLLNDPDVEVAGVLVHSFNMSRLRNEYKRDGKRILFKVLNKLILNDTKSLEFTFHTPKRFLVQTGVKANLKLLCESHNIYFKKVNSFNSAELVNEIKALNLDIGAFCGGGLLRDNFLSSFSIGVLNCHMGVLPKYRGMDVVEWPFLEKEPEETGITCHFIDKGIDTGDILEVARVDATNFKTFIELREYLSGVMLELMIKNIHALKVGDILKRSQLPSDGKQYFVMHPSLKKISKKIYSA